MAATEDTATTVELQPTQPNHTQLPNSDDAPPERQLSSTPPSDSNSNDIKTSRKREREVSLEPATPQATTVDIDVERPEGKERRTPAKKNRTSDVVLESTQEEVEDDIPLTGSPPHETKIRQISQGVEDITWQNMKKSEPAEGDVPGQKMEDDASAPVDEVASIEDDQTGPPADAQIDSAQASTPPPITQGENPPLLDDTAGVDEDTGAAANAEQPPDAQVDETSQPPSASSSTSQLSEAPRFPKTHRRDSDSDQEKSGMKRKLGDRTVSERLVPGETLPGQNGIATVGATKRPRDDPEADPNTREKKRPTPPPEEDEKAKAEKKEVSSPNLGGFMAYAATSSPFASVQGPRIFGGKQPSTSTSTSPWTSAGTSSNSNPNSNTFGSGSASPFASGSTSPSPLASAIAAKEAATPVAHKRTGFEAFASSTSPFASAAKRPKSPPPSNSLLGRSRSPSRHGAPRGTNAFSAYAAGGAQSFAAPTPKRSSGSPALGEGSLNSVLAFGTPTSSAHANANALDSGKEDEDSEKDSGVSFGERLRAGKDKDEEEASDEEKRLNLTEQEVMTGEEEEDTVYQVRGKLFTLSTANQWKERGTGMLRLNVRREDGGGARLVMRKEAVYTVLLNATLFKGMRCFVAQDPRYLRFSVFEAGTTTHYNLRVSNAKIAEELLEEINAHIPME